MSRELKFRGHVKDLGVVTDVSIHNKETNGEYRWFIHVEAFIEQYPNLDLDNDEELEKINLFVNDEYVYGISLLDQYTGKNDCKGVEIYENDQIYSCPGYSSVVLWDKEQASFISRYSHPEDPEDLLLSELGKDIHVITDEWMEDND